jgi:hypothetical protein
MNLKRFDLVSVFLAIAPWIAGGIVGYIICALTHEKPSAGGVLRLAAYPVELDLETRYGLPTQSAATCAGHTDPSKSEIAAQRA